MEFLLDGIRAVTPQQCVMYVVGALLIYLAIKKDYEPSLLLPMLTAIKYSKCLGPSTSVPVSI